MGYSPWGRKESDTTESPSPLLPSHPAPRTGGGEAREPGGAGPLQYSGLEHSMDCIVHGVTKGRTQLSNFRDEDLREPLVRRQGSQVSMRVARGSASLK